MSDIINLFLMFFKLCFFSFGGGYSMIPLIEQSLLSNNIVLSPETIADICAIAGIAPGPVGTNLAIGFGYEVAGFAGAVAAAAGVTFPGIIIVVIVATVFDKIYNSNYFKWALDGLKPVVVGIVIYVAVSMAIKNNIFADYKSLLIVAVSLGCLLKIKLHPIFLIAFGATCGILFY